MSQDLIDLVFQHDELAELDPAARRLAIRSLLVQERPDVELEVAVAEVADAIDGYGILSDVMRDETVTDVLVNGPREVWVERDGRLERTECTFASHDALEAMIDRLLAAAGARADRCSPIADTRLADGSRIHVVLPPLAPTGPLVSIRKFPERVYSLEDLTNLGMLTPAEAGTLSAAVAARHTIVISGGTGTGKTTLLNALLGCVSPHERVVTIEETPELRPRRCHAVSLVARPANVEGKGEVPLDDLVRAALRMRPDRVVVGEVRGREALPALAALSSGHEGSMLTVHARAAADVPRRLTFLALQAQHAPSEATLLEAFERAVDLVVHLARRDGARRVVSLCHV